MSEANRQKVAIVTGSSTGIGFETSLMLARNGLQTYAIMRKIYDQTNWFFDLLR
ncbi:MAG TPA: hypothetical protein VFI70_04320 [Nitrososphaeraceae archaeon]|nr:hypothetical protein [Nitrososphaeraceae archaeon]